MPRKTILVLLSSGEGFSLQKLSGIQGFADAVGWDLRTVEYSADGDGNCQLVRTPSGSDVASLLEFWRPDGCIVDCGRLPDLVEPRTFKGYPTVFVDRYLKRLLPGISNVVSDASMLVEAGVRELLRSNFEHFAYVPHPFGYVWSVERGEVFARYVRLNRKISHRFTPPHSNCHLNEIKDCLAAWVAALPKPCGILAANDVVAEAVVLACLSRNVRIPDDVALIGIDDISYICENSRPTISSVRRNLDQVGRTAAAFLQDVMERPKKVWPSRRYEGAVVVHRESTCFVKGGDRYVRTAIEFIRRHACEGIGPLDVVAELGCSRRLADLRFTQAMGHTILDEIHAVRLERVKELLRTPHVDYAALPDFCGYGSLIDLRRVFKKRTGMTMGEYRKSLS